MIRRQKDVLLNRNHSVRFKVHLLQMPLPASALRWLYNIIETFRRRQTMTHLTVNADEEDTEMGQRKCIESKGSNFACRIRDHVKMGPKFSETVKSKLSLGAKIIQKGGRENIFKQIFGLTEGEEFLKASQCYLSTTRGPIAGLLFISNKKIAFCSERSISYSSSTGELIRTPYKVLIPIQKIKSINESENVTKPEQKYVEIVTVDDFEFWFMGFLRYEKAYRNLQKAISMANEV